MFDAFSVGLFLSATYGFTAGYNVCRLWRLTAQNNILLLFKNNAILRQRASIYKIRAKKFAGVENRTNFVGKSSVAWKNAPNGAKTHAVEVFCTKIVENPTIFVRLPSLLKFLDIDNDGNFSFLITE